jgi:hypothetical protein
MNFCDGNGDAPTLALLSESKEAMPCKSVERRKARA